MKDTIKNTLSASDRLFYALSRYRGIGIEIKLKPYLRMVRNIKKYDYHECTQEELKEHMRIFQTKIQGGICAETLLPAVFALVSEACVRTLGIFPYTEQLIAATALAQGKMAQMQNGEGKTLAAVFPACLYSLGGKGVHILTANDYLAKRDAVWMSNIYAYLGINCAYIQAGMSQTQRKKAYLADITYLTAEQGGFDLLRDDRCRHKHQYMHREFHAAIVDEGDFIMIDQARLPLVIAGRAKEVQYDPYAIDAVIKKLIPQTDFQVNNHEHHIFLTAAGERKVMTLLRSAGMAGGKKPDLLAAVNVALYAHYMLHRDVDYIVKMRKILPIDEMTGRAARQKRWPYGIGRALQAKEGLACQPLDRILGTITIQNYLKLYPFICAMTATAVPAAKELTKIYGLDIVVIPPHRTVVRIDLPDVVFTTTKAKISAVIAEIGRVHRTGQPVLVGTSSVEESEKIAVLLKREGVPCRTLNAKNPQEQAELLACAGMPGAVTVSTHMAGRGSDIRLGGKNGEQRKMVADLGGLYVIGTSRHYSARVDNQLRGRCGRQGDPGVSRFFISLQDTMISRYGIHEFIPKKFRSHLDDRPVTHPKTAKKIMYAQSIIEERNSFMRNVLRRYNMLIELQRQQVRHIRSRAILRNTISDRVLMIYLDNFWADHLAFVEYIKQGMHLHAIARDEPLLVFIKQVSTHFVQGSAQAYKKTKQALSSRKNGRKINVLLRDHSRYEAVWSYVINEYPLPVYKVTKTADKKFAFALFKTYINLV